MAVTAPRTRRAPRPRPARVRLPARAEAPRPDPHAAHVAIEEVRREVPEINRKLVEPFADKLGDMAALAFFGI